MTKIKELLSDRYWRLNNLYWIQDPNGTKVKFRMNWAQRHFFASIWYLNQILKVRQIGMSTLLGIMQLDHALFSRDQSCGLIDRTDLEARKKLKRMKYAYDHLDDVDDPQTARLGAAIKDGIRLVTENDHEMSFTNGSVIWAGTTLRGSTVNFLHVSELGYIAHWDPKRADEIAAGSFNTVHAGNVICVEATHEGGRYGLNYELIRQAQRFQPETASPLDWKFHFFPWWGEPTYQIEPPGPVSYPVDVARYFEQLEKECRIKLSEAQKFWYFKKWQSPRVDMARQYPGTPEEALQAVVEGAIYAEQIKMLRAMGRICNFPFDDTFPLFTSWDLGQSDYHSIWLIQMRRLDFLVLDYNTGQRETPGGLAAQILKWERHYNKPILRHFLPHDADATTAVARSMKQELNTAGLRNLTVVPRTPDIWNGIKHLRSLLPSFYIHADNGERETELDGRILPSAVGCLEGYYSKPAAVGGRLLETPVHDASSHGADGLRTFAEAHQRGMVDNLLRGVPGAVTTRKPSSFKTKRGMRSSSPSKTKKEPRERTIYG